MLNKLVQKAKLFTYKLVSVSPILFSEKRVLIVKLDAIGDYVLFRNGLEHIVKCDRFKNHKFYLLGNNIWRDLAESLDPDFIEEFIWINPQDMYNRHEYMFARTWMLLRLKLRGFETVINPVHSRLLDIDCFIRDLGSKKRIASTGDDINYQPGEKKTGDGCYTELIKVSDHSHFEFYRNREFVQGLTGISANNIHFQIKSEQKKAFGLNIILAPGAGHARRQWPVSHFVATMLRLSKKISGVKYSICGSAADTDKAKEIIKMYKNDNVTDYTGTQSLPEFVTLLQNSLLLISNESSAVHLAIAVGLPAVCISNGNMFGRFNPYPIEMNKNVITIYSDARFYDPNQFAENVERFKVQSDLDISMVDPNLVAEKCLEIINQTMNKANSIS